MNPEAGWIGDITAAIVAVILIAADVYLTIHGTQDTGLQGAVPVIVAFYFGGRITSRAWSQRLNVENDATDKANAANGNGNGGK
jgi:hypothetical protein